MIESKLQRYVIWAAVHGYCMLSNNVTQSGPQT